MQWSGIKIRKMFHLFETLIMKVLSKYILKLLDLWFSSHIQDGVALAEFFSHLEEEIRNGGYWTEISASKLVISNLIVFFLHLIIYWLNLFSLKVIDQRGPTS